MINRSSIALLAILAACATTPSELPAEESFVVAVKCTRLPTGMPWYTRFAEHSWFDVCDAGKWSRVEVLSKNSGVLIREIDEEVARSDLRFGDRDVHVIACYTGEDAAAIGAQILAKAKGFPHADNYNAWPGPNSNTFVEWVSHQVDGLWLEQYPTAVGKDYPMNGWISAGLTTTRTGLELETPYLGAQVGLMEGAELHVVGLTLGIDLWPPQIKLPFLPGLPWGLAY